MKYTVSDGFPYYIQMLGDRNFHQVFESQENLTFFESITEEKSKYRYEPDKWSIKQMVGHITDHERIMIYRILRISRKDPTPLAGYDQNLLVANSYFDQWSFGQILDDLKMVRAATLSFLATLSEEQLSLKGLVWKFEMTVEEFLKSTIGHELHHVHVLKDKYLQ